MIYITFEEYTKLSGVITESSAFEKLERKARRKLDYFTQDRIKSLETITEEIKECMAEFIDNIHQDEELGPSVKSFNHDGVSVTFTDDEEDSLDKILWDIAVEYLPVELVALAVN